MLAYIMVALITAGACGIFAYTCYLRKLFKKANIIKSHDLDD